MSGICSGADFRYGRGTDANWRADWPITDQTLERRLGGGRCIALSSFCSRRVWLVGRLFAPVQTLKSLCLGPGSWPPCASSSRPPGLLPARSSRSGNPSNHKVSQWRRSDIGRTYVRDGRRQAGLAPRPPLWRDAQAERGDQASVRWQPKLRRDERQRARSRRRQSAGRVDRRPYREPAGMSRAPGRRFRASPPRRPTPAARIRDRGRRCPRQRSAPSSPRR